MQILIAVVIVVGSMLLLLAVQPDISAYSSANVSLNATIKKDNVMVTTDGDFRYYLQPPTKFLFTNTDNNINNNASMIFKNLTIVSPKQTYISLFKNGDFYFEGQLKVQVENATTLSTQLIDIHSYAKFDRTDYDKIKRITTYHIDPGLLSIGNLSWSSVQFSVKTFDNGTGIFSLSA